MPAGGPENAAKYYGTGGPTPSLEGHPAGAEGGLQGAIADAASGEDETLDRPSPALSAAEAVLVDEPPSARVGETASAAGVGRLAKVVGSPVVDGTINTISILAEGEEGPVPAAIEASAQTVGGEVGLAVGGLVANDPLLGEAADLAFVLGDPEFRAGRLVNQERGVETMLFVQNLGEQAGSAGYEEAREEVNEHPQGAAEAACGVVLLPPGGCATELRRFNEAVLETTDQGWEDALEKAEWFYQPVERAVEAADQWQDSAVRAVDGHDFFLPTAETPEERANLCESRERARVAEEERDRARKNVQGQESLQPETPPSGRDGTYAFGDPNCAPYAPQEPPAPGR